MYHQHRNAAYLKFIQHRAWCALKVSFLLRNYLSGLAGMIYKNKFTPKIIFSRIFACATFGTLKKCSFETVISGLSRIQFKSPLPRGAHYFHATLEFSRIRFYWGSIDISKKVQCNEFNPTSSIQRQIRKSIKFLVYRSLKKKSVIAFPFVRTM